jgi:hypothetical protein
MSVMLPALLAVPIVMIVLFELKFLDQLKAQTEPDDAGHISCVGRAMLYVRSVGADRIDRTIGAGDGLCEKRSLRARDQRQKTLARTKFKTMAEKAAEGTAHALVHAAAATEHAVERSAEEVVHAAALHVHVELAEKRSEETMAGAARLEVEMASSADEHVTSEPWAEPTQPPSPQLHAALEMLHSAESEISDLSQSPDRSTSSALKFVHHV